MITPLGARILIKPHQVTIQSDAPNQFGIIVPKTKEETEQIPQGEVIDIGSKCEEKLKKGDKVFYSKYGLEELIVNNESYLIVAEANVICKLKDYI